MSPVKLSVATNFDPLLVESMRKYPVVELFGKLREDAVGGGRAPYQLAPVTRKRLEEHVRHARRAGIEFNYLLNASCLGNSEITREGQKEIEELAGWLCEIGVASVTVAIPYMLKLIKTRYPRLKVRVSVFGGVDRVRKAQMWEELGADSIVLDSILINMLLLKRLADLLSMTRPVEGDPLVYIDNRALDGFMERFRERGCREDDCGECRWCHEFAGKSIRMDEGKRTRALAACDEIFRALHDGSMWRYLPGKKG